MKRQTSYSRSGLTLTVLFAAVFFATFSHASGPIPAEQGFSGDLNVLGGVISSRSNLAVSGDQRQIDSLDELQSRHSRAIAGVLGQVNYTVVPSRFSLYAGTPLRGLSDGRLVLELGMRYQLEELGQLRAGVIPLALFNNEVWVDPFLTGQNRERTDRDSYGFNLAWTGIYGTGFSVDYQFLRHDINRDQAGFFANVTSLERRQLRRGGDEHQFIVNYRLPLTQQWSLMPELRYTRYQADGAVNRGWLLRPQLTASFRQDNWRVSLTGFVGLDRYDQKNPLLDGYQDSEQYGVVAGVRYHNPFGWENWSVDALGIWSERDADVRFYDGNTHLFSIGVGYQF